MNIFQELHWALKNSIVLLVDYKHNNFIKNMGIKDKMIHEPNNYHTSKNSMYM